MPAVREMYARWAAAHNGPLTRDGASFTATDEQAVEGRELTLALDDDGELVGYALWSRTGGYHAEGVLEVDDLVALTDQGLRLLLRTFGTSAAVAPTTVIATSTPDLAALVLPSHPWQVKQANPYCLAVLDVARAFGERAYAPWLDFDLTFAVHGLPVGGQDGAYRLRVTDGSATVERVDDAEIAYNARGLALRYAGTHSCADLRRAGLLSGPAQDDDRWDAAFGGRRLHIRDYF